LFSKYRQIALKGEQTKRPILIRIGLFCSNT
jgi:hypothetical protein